MRLSLPIITAAALFLRQTTALATQPEVLAAVEGRQIDCSKYDKSFPGPVYTGPCEYENCGARGTNCKETGWSGCVQGPAFGCPRKFCACSNY